MTHPNKVRGNALEREIVNQAKEFGLDAKRAYASNGEAMGEVKEVDLVINDSSGSRWRVQAKRRKKLAGFLAIDDGVDAVIFRQDRAQSMVLLPYNTFLRMLRDGVGQGVSAVHTGHDSEIANNAGN